jgi:hypothetical protein
VKRREFLFLRTDAATRVAELSCQRLYMHYQHAWVTTIPAGDDAVDGGAGADDAEPPTAFTVRTPGELFGEVARQLQGADVLRLVDTEWLALDEFRRDVESVLDAFRDRGGRVESPGLAQTREATR